MKFDSLLFYSQYKSIFTNMINCIDSNKQSNIFDMKKCIENLEKTHVTIEEYMIISYAETNIDTILKLSNLHLDNI